MASHKTLWINHDADHMKALSHRHQVFSHIQNVYCRHERQQKAKALRASAKIPKALNQKGTSMCTQSNNIQDTDVKTESALTGPKEQSRWPDL